MKCYGRNIHTALAFGIGLIVATILPCQWVLVIASITILIVALCICRR
ncbi:MAG: hypothetical protein PUD53_04160 [Oscillospiraceae bacterium]|nr:hypothetical protein [Oscillospiraceae bacterium]